MPMLDMLDIALYVLIFLAPYLAWFLVAALIGARMGRPALLVVIVCWAMLTELSLYALPQLVGLCLVAMAVARHHARRRSRAEAARARALRQEAARRLAYAQRRAAITAVPASCVEYRSQEGLRAAN